MSDDRCPYCQAPYKGDLDENGKLFCECDGSRVAELEAEIDRLREAQRWIPVGERLPEDFDDVLVIVGTKYRHIMYRQSGCWWKHGWPQDGADVTHWMPLPEPLHEA